MTLNEQAARDFTDGLGTVLKGSWQLIKSAKEMGVPEALGMTTEEWVRDKLGGYTKLPPEERKAAALELKEEGYSTREAAEILGVNNATVARDLNVANATEHEDERPELQALDTVPVANATEKAKPHVAQNARENEWYTPPEFLEAARSVMGSIDTDPASSEIANQTVQAEIFYTHEDNGLAQPWSGNVWMNPPYSQPLVDEFSTALISRWRDGQIQQACVLVNNATDTQWFQRMAKRAAFICLPMKRIKFLDPEGNPGAPLQGQAVLYFGDRGGEFVEHFSQFGAVAKILRQA